MANKKNELLTPGPFNFIFIPHIYESYSRFQSCSQNHWEKKVAKERSEIRLREKRQKDKINGNKIIGHEITRGDALAV